MSYFLLNLSGLSEGILNGLFDRMKKRGISILGVAGGGVNLAFETRESKNPKENSKSEEPHCVLGLGKDCPPLVL